MTPRTKNGETKMAHQTQTRTRTGTVAPQDFDLESFRQGRQAPRNIACRPEKPGHPMGEA